MGISLVVLTYGKWELTHRLMSDILQFFPHNELIVVDNGSEDDRTENGVKFWSGMMDIVYARSDTNMGFAGGANFGIKEASEDIIAVISNDVRITNKWPYAVVNRCTGDTVLGGIMRGGDTGWNKFGDRLFPYLEGWFLATTKDMWKKLDYFDERYNPHDYEDIDLSTKALQLGLKLEPIEAGLKHSGGGTIGFNPEREKITKINRERFMKKWL